MKDAKKYLWRYGLYDAQGNMIEQGYLPASMTSSEVSSSISLTKGQTYRFFRDTGQYYVDPIVGAN